MRIALFSDSFLPVLNGVSISIKSLVEELRHEGHSVHIFTAGATGHKDSDPNVHRFWSMQTPWTKGYPLAFPPFYPMLPNFRRREYDVIHTHTPWTIGFVGLRWAQSHDIPVVATYHTLYDKYSHYIPRIIPKRYLRYRIAKHTNFYYNSVNHVITPSEASKRWLIRHSVKKPIEVIPTAQFATQDLDRAELRRKHSISPNSTVLLFVGRIAREKNMQMLLEAVALAMRDDSSLLLLLVGDGPMHGECLQLASRLGIGDRVRFVGFVPRTEVDQFYALADIFVFASVTETQGLVVSEAMSYGLPPVVVFGGGAGAGVTDGVNGFLTRNDPEAFAENISALVRDEELYSRISSAARLAVRGYTAADMAQRVVDVYEIAIRDHARVKVGSTAVLTH